MKKVLIYSNMYPSKQKAYSGIFVKNQFELLKKMNEGRMHFDVLAMEREFTDKGGSIRKYLFFMCKSISYIFKNKFDIIHLHYFFPLAIIPWLYKKMRSRKNKSIKLVLTVHGADLYEQMNNKFIFSIFKHILKSYDYIISVGEDMKIDFEKKFDIKVDRVLCAGIDKNIFYPLNTTKSFDFLFVGSVIHRKGFDLVLNIIKRDISSASQISKWCVVGDGEYSDEISKLAERYPYNCTYYRAKTQSELNEIYNQAKWFFFPSRNEPFGLVISESIFAGTPVICSSSGGLKEQVKEKYNGRILNDVDNSSEMESVINWAKNVSHEEYNLYRENCLKSNDSFSLQYVCGELSTLYESM